MRNICVLTDVNNIVIAYGICLSDRHIPIENGVIVETNLDLEVVELVSNYKLIDDRLVELTEEEKPIVEQPLSELDKLKMAQAEQFEYILEILGGM